MSSRAFQLPAPFVADSETGRLFSQTDWSATALGATETWPQSLRAAVGICLNSRFPMFVWWGDKLVNIYNDAYIPVLGKRHPTAFGRPARESWEEIWPVVGPQAEAVMQRGQATWNERVLLVMERNGYPENTYFTWSYSPILDESGGIGGLFCACVEETPRLQAERQRDALLAQVENERARLASVFSESPAFVAVMRGPEHVFEFVNQRYCELIGPRELIGRPVRQALPEVADQGFFEILDRVYASGEPYVGTAQRLLLASEPHLPLSEAFVDFVYQPMRDEQGNVVGIMAHGIDLTERHRLEARDRFLVAIDDAVRPLADPAQITATCARMLGEYLRVNRCAYADVEADEDTFNLTGDYNNGVASIVGRYRFGQFGEHVLQLMREDRPFVCHDVDSYEPALGELAAYHLTAIQAVVCVPLHKAGRFVAAMAVHQSTPRRWTAAEVELVQHVAARCWESIERTRVERALRESEMRFRHMSDNAPVMIWVTAPDGYCEYLNKQWYVFTGQSEKEALGLGWLDALHPEDVARTRQAFLDSNAAREPFKLDFRLRRRDGQYRYCVDTGAPRMGSDGSFLGYIGTVVDITDRKLVEDALESEKRVLQMIATGSQVTDVLELIARRVEAQSGDGMHCAILLCDDAGERWLPPVAPSLPEAYCQALQTLAVGLDRDTRRDSAYERRGDNLDVAARLRWNDLQALAAQHGLMACSYMPITDGDGQTVGLVVAHSAQCGEPTAHDVELTRAASHLAGIVVNKHVIDRRLRDSLQAEQDARSEAERASFMKDEFLATLSHELRTPLNAILGWLAILKLRGMPAEVAQGVDVIERNARAQAQIIEELLDMSGIISGKVRLQPQRLNLADILHLSAETARPTAAAKDVNFELRLHTAEEVPVNADPHRLQQILWNLISNAIKFTPPGGHVVVELERLNGSAEIRVRDDGEGMTPQFLPFVFDRFRQADASTTRRHGGLGLGLSITKKLVELHGGAIQASSEGPNRGATFTVILPDCAPLAELAAAQPVTERQIEAVSLPQASEAPIAGLRVLVVDDDADAREVAKRLLEDHDAQVTTAASAHDALRLLEENEFDMLVSDIGMPGMDGYGLIRQVRMRVGDIPAIALTAYARADDRAKAMRAGFQLHVAKPVESTKLIASVASLARRPAVPS